MSDIATKLTYLNTTKSKIKESINLTGANLTNETFRQYATVLKDTLAHILKNPSPIWDNFPKTTATGSTIQVNTYDSWLDYDLLGNTTQNGTPTPTTPIPISNVSGLQEVKVCGKNLFNKDNVRAGYRFGSDGDYYANTGYNATEYIGVQPSTLYSVNWSMAWDEVVCTYDINKNFVRRIISGTNFTTSASEYYIRADVSNAHLSTAQIEKGSTSTYEPYKGNTYEINLGKNLFDISLKPSSAIDYENGFTLLKSTNRTLRISLPQIYTKGTYTLSYDIHNSNLSSVEKMGVWLQKQESGSTTNIVSGNDNATHTLILNATNDFDRIYFFINNDQADTATISINNIQLEKGSTKTSYSPYFTPIELNKIGNYKDYIFKGKGVNLFDKDNTQWYRNNNGVFSDTTDTSTNRIRTTSFEIQGGKTYKLSGIPSGLSLISVRTYTSPSASNVDVSPSNNSFTLNSNVKYIHLLFSGSNFTSATNTLMANADLMLNEGTSALPYEPYNAKDKWLLHKEIGKVVLNGSENWSANNVQWGSATYMQYFISYNLGKTGQGYSNHFTYNSGDTGVGNHFYINSSGTLMVFPHPSYNGSDIANTTEWKSWLASNNTIVYYVLANPTTTEITNSELLDDLDSIELLDGLNNITINGDLSAIMDLIALAKE